jgi:transposase
MGLWDCLQKRFGKKTNEIIAVAAFMIREGNAMDGIDDWQEKNLIPGLHKLLTSQSCSKLFKSLDLQSTDRFFIDWVKKALEDDTVCYDVTSVSSYSKLIPDVEYGYNRDHEELPQFNIGMFCGETTKMPIYYNRYNGSLTDKSNLSHVLENARSVGIKDIKLVLDGGFMSENCFSSLSKLCKSFTIGISSNLDIAKEMISANLTEITKFSNKLPEREIFCVQQETSIHGTNGKLMLFFDQANHNQLCSELSDRIERLSAELSELKRCPVSKLARFSKYFLIQKHENDSGFDFMVNTTEVDKIRATKGFFLIFTTNMMAKPEDILYFYRAKDADEKLFDQIKIDMKGNRVHTHNKKTIYGKIFVTFIALVIRSYILRGLEKYISANSSSLKKAMNKLENIIVIHTDETCRFAKALTKQQKEILEPFKATVDITSSLESCLR